jgi:ABC-type glycerol-3-phosphate transport system substrate-binding protein
MKEGSVVQSRYGRAAALASAAAVIALSASACAGGGSSSSTTASSPSVSGAAAASGTASPSSAAITAPVTITFDEVYGTGTQKTAMQAMIAAFEKANPMITVKPTTYANYGALLTAETAQVSAGKPPTIGQAYESWAEKFATSQVITPISELPGASSTMQTDLSSFYTGVQNDLKLPDGQIWMWPFAKSLQVLFYNQNMLTAAGSKTPPTTWRQFATALKAASKNGVVGITIDPGSAAEGATSGTEWLEELAAANGSPVYQSDGTPQFTSSGAVSALNYLVDLKKAGALATGANYPGETALGAKKGLADLSSSAGYYFETQAVGGKFPLTTTGLPAGTSGSFNEMAGANLVVFSSATDQQKTAAWKFLEFASSPAQQAAWSAGTGYYPVTSQALTQPAMATYLKQNPWVNTTIGGLNTAIVDPPYAWVTQCDGYLATALSAALSGTGATSALNTAQSACTTAKSNA